MAYIGVQPAEAYTSFAVQHFTTSATTSYTLDNPVANENEIALFINNVRQQPGSSYAYTASGTSLTLSAATSASDTMYCVFIGKAVQSVTPAVGSVTNDMLSSGSFSNITGTGTLTNFTSTGIDDNADSTAITINSSEQVIIGGTTPENSSVRLEAQDATNPILQVKDTTSNIYCGLQAGNSNAILRAPNDAPLVFVVGSAEPEHMRINQNGEIFTGLSSNYGTDPTTMTGTGKSNMMDAFGNASNLKIARAGDSSIQINRTSDDGNLMIFRQDGTNEGTITVSGSTINYNGFTGTHWTRLSDNSKPTILKGTILESLDEMMDWYQITFDIGEEGEENILKISHTLQEGQSVGDTITYNHNGVDYTATIIKEDDIKHSKCKVSDTTDSKAVYGVFVSWDEDDDDGINDIYIAQTGTFVVRLNSSVTTLNKGDLIQSNGDGTGKVQADDIIRASTVAKVLSTTKIETYDDGSYIVPCSLHC